jgi:hypothetical protein
LKHWRAAQAVGAVYAGVDLEEEPDGFSILEVNGTRGGVYLKPVEWMWLGRLWGVLLREIEKIILQLIEVDTKFDKSY